MRSRRVGEDGLDGQPNRGGVGHEREHGLNVRQQLVEEGFEATLLSKFNPKSARPRIFDGAAEAK